MSWTTFQELFKETSYHIGLISPRAFLCIYCFSVSLSLTPGQFWSAVGVIRAAVLSCPWPSWFGPDHQMRCLWTLSREPRCPGHWVRIRVSGGRGESSPWGRPPLPAPVSSAASRHLAAVCQVPPSHPPQTPPGGGRGGPSLRLPISCSSATVAALPPVRGVRRVCWGTRPWNDTETGQPWLSPGSSLGFRSSLSNEIITGQRGNSCGLI